jgi:DNA mismatch repair protein MutL
LSSEDKTVYNCPAVTQAADRITQLWDHSIGKQMITVEHHNDKYGISVTGVTSSHEHHRYDRSAIFFFVNKRWVKNQTLSSALVKGYHHVLPQGKYPLSALMITLDSHDVDINIHPRKEEVKFMNPRVVEQTIQDAVRLALERHVSATINIPVQFAASTQNIYTQPRSFTFLPTEQKQNSTTPWVSSLAQQKIEKNIPEKTLSLFNAYESKLAEMPFKEETTPIVVPEAPKHHHIIGQFQKTYIIIEKDDGLFFVDQHAAHERILYESFKTRFKEAAHVTLLFPHLITLTSNDKALIEPHLNLFTENNILIEPFGSNQLRIVATPVHLQAVPLEPLVREVIGWLKESDEIDHERIARISEKMHAQMACKAAVKAGDVLSMEQMHKLLRDLDGTRSNYCCPHGRPTGWLLSLSDIEKKFKRDYKGAISF